jgi:hypothetical protein
MRAQQAIPSDDLQEQVRRFWNMLLTFSLVVPAVLILTYYGYCFGLWGRKILLLQYSFQCSCPSFSEEWRYPQKVDVIVSACPESWVEELSPSGRLLSVYEKNAQPYILDLTSNEKILLSLPQKSGFHFLTDTLLYVSLSYDNEAYSRYNENYILDRTTHTTYPILRFQYVYPGSYINARADPTILANALGQARYVFFRDWDDMIIALDPDFPASVEGNFLVERFDIRGENPDRSEQFLQDNNIGYLTILPGFPHEAVSPNGKFIARYDGIYLIETDQKIVDGYKFSWYDRSYSGQYLSVRGWKYDSSGAIYSQYIGPCLFEPPGLDGPSCLVEVPQPVLLLRLPEEYLSPTP